MGRPENITLEKYWEANSSDERTQIVEDTFAYIKEIEKQYNMRKVSISATEKAQLISSLSILLVNNKTAGTYKQLQTDCVNKLELLVSSIEL